MRNLLTRFSGYSLAWFGFLLAFASMSARILEADWRRNLMERLESEAVLTEGFLSSTNSYQDRASLDRFCKSFGVPERRGERITFFARDGRLIADSRLGAPFASQRAGAPARPEVAFALKKGVGREVRLSQGSMRMMAFVAYPHVHLGQVVGVVRLGAPISWRDNLLLGIYLKVAALGILVSFFVAVLQGPVRRFLQRLYSPREFPDG